jgi:hypothetical protein
MTMDHCESEGGYMLELNTPEEEDVVTQQVSEKNLQTFVYMSLEKNKFDIFSSLENSFMEFGWGCSDRELETTGLGFTLKRQV